MADALRNTVERRADEIHPESNESSLEAYGKLIKMLIPRAQSIAVYGVGGVPLWVAGGQDDPDMQGLAVELFRGPAGEPNCIDGTTRDFNGAAAYGCVLRDGQGLPSAVVVLVARQSSEAHPIALVLELLRPVLDCLRRDRELNASLADMRRDLASRDGDLEILLSESVQHVDASRDVEELGRLVQVAVDHLNCDVGTLMIPERSIAIVRKHRDHQRDNEADIVARTHRHLLAWAKLQCRTMIVNKVAATKEVPQFKILSVPVRHLSERVIGFLAFFNRVDAPDFALRQARLAELLSHKVTSVFLTGYDSATGLLVRNSFERRVNALLAASPGLRASSIVYFDIDRLHVINENSGMHVGDEVIARVADVIRRRAPHGALCARMSGDRFAMFIAGAEVGAAASAAEQIRKEVIDLSEQGQQSVARVTVSAGVALVSISASLPLSQALTAAEIASNAAKDHGRDRVEIFDQGDGSMVRRHGAVRIVAGLHEALATSRFCLYAQPILPLGALTSGPRFEILMRMRSEVGELLSPAKFLPAAERYQQMPAIDRWVVENALEALREHAQTARSLRARFAINVSGQSVTDPATTAFIEAQVRASGIPPESICFELTETTAVKDLAQADSFMQRLRSIGCQFALDDFGTGVSSLSYLKSLPISVIKIDGSFVRDVLVDPGSDMMVGAIAQLARAVNMTTVAECVETDAVLQRMAHHGVDYAQGFAMGRPVALIEVLQKLSLYELVAVSDRADDVDGTMGFKMTLN